MTKRIGDPEKNQLLLGNDEELNLTNDDLKYVLMLLIPSSSNKACPRFKLIPVETVV